MTPGILSDSVCHPAQAHQCPRGHPWRGDSSHICPASGERAELAAGLLLEDVVWSLTPPERAGRGSGRCGPQTVDQLCRGHPVLAWQLRLENSKSLEK
jgi:hypothetical protein